MSSRVDEGDHDVSAKKYKNEPTILTKALITLPGPLRGLHALVVMSEPAGVHQHPALLRVGH